MTFRTLDRSSDVYTVEKVGRTQEVTPEGYLLCRDVPIARTGEMLYAAGELKDDKGTVLRPGPDGVVRVDRGEAEVFRPETIASANGKSVTDDHPDDDVMPDTWADLTVGIVLNPRRGDRTEDQLLLADFLITKPAAIQAIRDGKREVSCGYDASYEQTEPGSAVQRNIIFNHVALVEHGRCGPRCSIGDQTMPKIVVNSRRSWKDRVMDAFKSKDEEALKKELEGATVHDDAGGEPDDGQHIHIHLPSGEGAETKDDDPPAGAAEADPPAWFTQHVEQNNARFDKIEGAIAKLAPAQTETPAEGEQVTDEELKKEPDGTMVKDEDLDPEGEKDPLKAKDKKTRDAAMKSDFQDAVSRAELIIPGVKLPTYDEADPVKATCLFRRRVLYRASTHAGASKLVGQILGKSPDFKAMTCDAVKIAFNAVSELSRSQNNGSLRSGTYDRGLSTVEPPTLAEMNKRNRDFWKDKSV